MKISLEWLCGYLDRPVSREQAEHLLTEQGLPLDAAEPVAGGQGDDWMLDVEVTSNRPDCLSHLGLAREVAAGAGLALRPPDCDVHEAPDAPGVETLTSVENARQDLCPLYTARAIRGVKIGPSPKWLASRLEAIGMRPVNNVVDVTNFVMMELGQPLHAFDMNLLDEKRIVVRPAARGERFEAIDGSKHELREDMLVIADARRAVAIAGVMGGLESEVGAKTTDILLESAMFDPLSVRRTSRALRLSSDSSYRFERGVDPAGVELASRRAAKLIVELAGGVLAGGAVRVGIDPPGRKAVMMRVARCHALLGIKIAPREMVSIFERLDLQPALEADGAAITCHVPTFRLDLMREVDLIEEVARIHGLDHIHVQEKIHIQAQRVQPEVAARQKLSQAMIAHGYHETINFSFVRPALGEGFVPEGEGALLIDDERRKAEPMLRPSLLASLLICRKSNQDAGNTEVKLYETASTYTRREGAIVERRKLAMLCDVAASAEQTLRDMRGTLEELTGALGGENAKVMIEPVAHPLLSAAGRVSLGEEAIGFLGVVGPEAQHRFGLQGSVAAAEVDLPALLALYPPRREVRALPRFPGIERDLSILVAEEVAWREVLREVSSAKPALLEEVAFLGAYRGKPIPKGQKSVSLRMHFRDPDRTLRHEEVDPQVRAVLERLTTALGAALRV